MPLIKLTAHSLSDDETPDFPLKSTLGGRKRDRQTDIDRQADRQTGRQTDRDRQADGRTDGRTDERTGRQAGGQADRQAETERDREMSVMMWSQRKRNSRPTCESKGMPGTRGQTGLLPRRKVHRQDPQCVVLIWPSWSAGP